MRRRRCLDLYGGGGGGAGWGYHLAEFDVTGVDKFAQPDYPLQFIQADAVEYLTEHGREYDFIHASPPCQAHTDLRNTWNAHEHEDLIPATREALIAVGRPYVIENVEGAPLKNPVVLCGSMFGLGADGYRLERHRQFESSFLLPQPSHFCRDDARPVVGVYGGESPQPAGDRHRISAQQGRDHAAAGNRAAGDGNRLAGTRKALPGHPPRVHQVDRRALAGDRMNDDHDGWWHDPHNGAEMSRSESQRRVDRAHRTLAEDHGIPYQLESGHIGHLSLSHQTGDWQLAVYHPGDSTAEGSAISHLGTDDRQVPARAAATFRDPEVVRRMGEQWKRAYLNGDPTGTRPELRTWDLDSDEEDPGTKGTEQLVTRRYAG
jgi:DNA (cytosine-5)-methyltransferase 1